MQYTTNSDKIEIFVQTPNGKRHAGILCNVIFYCRRNRARHLMRQSNSLAFNKKIIDDLNFRVVVVDLENGFENERLFISRERVKTFRVQQQGQFEPQYFVPLKHFSRTTELEREPKPETPKEEPAQLSMFGGIQ